MNNREWLESLAVDNPAELTAWFDSEHVDACPIGGVDNHKATIAGVEINDSDESLRQEALQLFLDYPNISDDSAYFLAGCVAGFLDRQAGITRNTEQAEWIKQANGLIHEANLRADELQAELEKRDKGIERLKRQRDEAREERDHWQSSYIKTAAAPQDQVERLEAERDELTNAINELQKKQPYCYDPEAPLDTLRTVGRYIDELTAERDEWKAKAESAERAMNHAAGKWAKSCADNSELRKMLMLDDGTVEDYTERVDPLTALAHQKQLAEEWRDRCHNAEALCDKLQTSLNSLNAVCDNLAYDLAACNREREGLRKMLGIAIDHAHDIIQLMNNDFSLVDNGGEVV